MRIADTHTGPVDLLLTDVVMPEMNGPALAAKLVGQGRLRRVLFMSGYAGESLAALGADHTNLPLLVKPFTPQELAARVREVLDKPA